MEWGILKSALYGLIMGFTEFLPVSSDAHSDLFRLFTGSGDEILAFRMLAHLSGLLILIIFMFPAISRMRREKRIAALPPKKRRRQPDGLALLDIRVVKTMSIFAVVFGAAACYLNQRISSVLLRILLLALNGLLLYLCRVLPMGNKDSRSYSVLNAIATGAALGSGTLNGISCVGSGITSCCLQGGDKKYAFDMVLIAMIPLLAMVTGFEIFTVASVGIGLSFRWILGYIVTVITSAVGAYFGLSAFRFLIVKTDFSGFAYYCWGLALFTICLYLII